MDHLETRLAERASERIGGRWADSRHPAIRFCLDLEEKLAAALGDDWYGDFDGVESHDGYSVDGAYDAYCAGQSVDEYVTAVMARRANLAKSGRLA